MAKKRANETTVIVTKDGQVILTVPRALAADQNFKSKDIIRWSSDTRGGLYVRKVRLEE